MSYVNFGLRLDEEGLKILIYVELDSTSASVMEYHVRKPDDTTATWTATQHTDATYLSYTTQTGDLDQLGDYEIIPYIEKGSLKKFGNEPVIITVDDKWIK